MWNRTTCLVAGAFIGASVLPQLGISTFAGAFIGALIGTLSGAVREKVG